MSNEQDRQVTMRGTLASTRMDNHKHQLTLDDLQVMKNQIETDERNQLIYWEHHTTLIPIGKMTKLYIESAEDKMHYLLNYDGYLFVSADEESLNESLIFTSDDLQEKSDISQSLDQIFLAYDPMNFDEDTIYQFTRSLKDQVDIKVRHHLRKSDVAEVALWLFLGGFFAKYGEATAEMTLATTRKVLKHLSSTLTKLINSSKTESNFRDLVIGIPLEQTNVIVEASIENPNEVDMNLALNRLPELNKLTLDLINNHRPNYFSIIRFIFNPLTQVWEVNYLVTRSGRLIKGQRYNSPTHPLYPRYSLMLAAMNQFKISDGKWGMSYGVTNISDNSENPDNHFPPNKGFKIVN